MNMADWSTLTITNLLGNAKPLYLRDITGGNLAGIPSAREQWVKV
jgi:hypothetical protein